MPPLGLTDDQLDVIQRLAEPLDPQDRDACLRRVAALLDGHEIGDGAISRAARQAQHELFRPPDVPHEPVLLRKGAARNRTFDGRRLDW